MPRTLPAGQRPGPWQAAARAHALAAATLHGLAVFPLSRSKLPAIGTAHPDDEASSCTGECGRFGHGVHDATTNPDRIRALFAAAPWAAGYGIACGHAPHHLFGLDLDRKNGIDGPANFHRLAREHGIPIPRTATILTHSGGLHLWWTAPAHVPIPNSASLLADGIDTRGSGGYLVGPGSLGPNGRYRFAPGSGPTPIAPAPPQLLRMLLAARQETRPESGTSAKVAGTFGSPNRRLDALVQVVLDCGPRDLNNRLYWASRKAFTARDIDPATAAARLLAAAVRMGHPETGARRTITSARRGAHRDTHPEEHR